MGIRLWLLYLHTPRSVLTAELKRVRAETVGALESLVGEECPHIERKDGNLENGSLENMRREMAHTHERLVSSLVDCMGTEEGVRLGREHLYRAGLKLGEEARRRLGVIDSLEDTLRAARVLYRVLGIEFSFERGLEGGTLLVNRCALSSHYSPTTCRVLSAADEGVLRGLNPRLRMRFEETITGGKERCRAKVIFEGRR